MIEELKKDSSPAKIQKNLHIMIKTFFYIRKIIIWIKFMYNNRQMIVYMYTIYIVIHY